MKFFIVSAALLALSPGLVLGQDDGPRQLGAPPALPPPPPRRTEAPRQLNSAPAADTVRRAVAPAPTPAPATPVYEPTPAGKLPGGSTRAARYRVGLKTGMVYNVYDVELKSPLFGRNYLLLDGQRRIEFEEVSYYEDETGHYVRTTLPGASRESTLRRDKTGRISLYSITSTQYSPTPYGGRMGYGGFGYGGMGYGGYPGGYRTVKTEYFSKDNGPIQYLNHRNLTLATSDNAGAQQLLADARRYQRASVAAYAVGGGLMAYGIMQTLRSPASGGARISPLMFAALPVLVVPIVLQSKQASNQRQAIALYNSAQ